MVPTKAADFIAAVTNLRKKNTHKKKRCIEAAPPRRTARKLYGVPPNMNERQTHILMAWLRPTRDGLGVTTVSSARTNERPGTFFSFYEFWRKKQNMAGL